MSQIRTIGIAAGLVACAAVWGQPVGAVRGQGQVVTNGRAAQRGGTATYLKAGDEVAVQTGNAVLNLLGGTRLYLEAGSRVKLEAGGQGRLGLRVLSGQGAFRLGEGASLEGSKGVRQGLIAVERTLARVYPMVALAPVSDAGAGRAASTVPPIRSVDISASTLPPAPAAPGTSEIQVAGQTILLPQPTGPGGTYTQTSYFFTVTNGQNTPPQIVIPGRTVMITVIDSSSGVWGVNVNLEQLGRVDDEALWWLAGAPVKRGSKQ